MRAHANQRLRKAAQRGRARRAAALRELVRAAVRSAAPGEPAHLAQAVRDACDVLEGAAGGRGGAVWARRSAPLPAATTRWDEVAPRPSDGAFGVEGAARRVSLARTARDRAKRGAYAVRAQLARGDRDSLVRVLEVSRHLRLGDAVRLVIAEFAPFSDELPRLLRRFGDVYWFAPLFARLAGPAGVRSIADDIRRLAR